METLGDRVKAEREARDWSQKELARRVVRAGAKSMSQVGIHKIETSPNVQPKSIVQIAAALGVNPRWLQTGRGEKYIGRGLKPDLPPVVRRDEYAAPFRGNVVSIRELDVHIAAGMGADDAGTILASQETGSIIGTHVYPANSFREAYGVDPRRIRILPVRGMSMEPELWPGQRVMVDIEDRTPSPPGIFAVWDGLALVLKYVEVVANSDPLRVRISSAHQAFHPYERNIGEAHINGRVIGVWKRM